MSWERFGARPRRPLLARGHPGSAVAFGAAVLLSGWAGPLLATRGPGPWTWAAGGVAAVGAAGAVVAWRAGQREHADVGPSSRDEAPRSVPPVLVIVARVLTVAWWLGLLVVVGAIGAGLFGPRTFVEGPDGGLTIGTRFDVPGDVVDTAVPAVGADGDREAAATSHRVDGLIGSVTIAEPGARDRAVVILVGGLGLAAALVAVHQLRGVIRSAVDGDPFAAPNARRLRVVGAVTILAGLGWEPLHSLVVSQTVGRVAHGGPPVSGPSTSSLIVLAVPGLILLAVAEIFRWGHGLRDDQALTV